jgi:hypothetical protein
MTALYLSIIRGTCIDAALLAPSFALQPAVAAHAAAAPTAHG